jgi:NADPH2:quinone reductase
VHYTATSEELRRRTGDLFTWLADGRLRPIIGGRYRVDEVRDDFAALESRRTTGKIVVVH